MDMERPARTSGSRFATVAWAATVLALLVIPPALSAGQQAGEPAAEPTPPPASEPPAAPPQSGQGSEQQDGGPPAPAPAPAPQPAAAAADEDVAVKSQAKPQAKPAASQTVSVGDNFYSPRSVTINIGDTITWTNNGSADHSATADNGSFDTGVFGPGGSRSHTFTQAGTFDYFCTVHGQAQSGTVTVASSGGGGGGGGGQSEAAAVASEDAAGTSSSLPSTGSETLPPMVVGLLLLLAGLALRFRDWFGPA